MRVGLEGQRGAEDREVALRIHVVVADPHADRRGGDVAGGEPGLAPAEACGRFALLRLAPVARDLAVGAQRRAQARAVGDGAGRAVEAGIEGFPAAGLGLIEFGGGRVGSAADQGQRRRKHQAGRQPGRVMD